MGDLLTTAEAAETLGVSVSQLRNWISRGRGPVPSARKSDRGRGNLFAPAEVERVRLTRDLANRLRWVKWRDQPLEVLQPVVELVEGRVD